MTGSRPGRRRQRGTIDRLPSGALRVRVYAGEDPLTGRRCDLVEVVPPGPKAAALAEAARTRMLSQVDEHRNPQTSATLDLERDRLSRQATIAARAATSHDGQTRQDVLGRVDRQLRAEVACGLHGVAHAALAARGNGPTVEAWPPRAVLETALADVRSRKDGWTRADLTRAVNAALPNYLGIPDEDDVGRLLDQLADEELALAVEAAYERIFVDALGGDSAHFARMDNLEQAWRIVGPVLNLDMPPAPYRRGTGGPAAAALAGPQGWVDLPDPPTPR
jgi:Glucose-6-phosphate dehydrogenase, C-terminal domain